MHLFIVSENAIPSFLSSQLLSTAYINATKSQSYMKRSLASISGHNVMLVVTHL